MSNVQACLALVDMHIARLCPASHCDASYRDQYSTFEQNVSLALVVTDPIEKQGRDRI